MATWKVRSQPTPQGHSIHIGGRALAPPSNHGPGAGKSPRRRHSLLRVFDKASTAIRGAVARVERGFAVFAEIPYQDDRAPQDISQLLTEFEAECGAQTDDRGIRAGH